MADRKSVGAMGTAAGRASRGLGPRRGSGRLLVSLALFVATAAGPAARLRALEPGGRASAAAESAKARGEITALFARLARPLLVDAPEGKAWLLEARGEWDGGSATLRAAWDAGRRAAVEIEAPLVGELALAIGPAGGWLRVPSHEVLFRAEEAAPATGSILEASRLAAIARARLAAVVAAAGLAPLPEGVRLAKAAEGRYAIDSRPGGWRATIAAPKGRVERIEVGVGAGCERLFAIEVSRSELVDARELERRLALPSKVERVERVEARDLRAMLPAAVDLLLEKLLWSVDPGSVPDLLAGVPRVDGHPVLVLRGTPEEIGREYGRRLKAATLSNFHRILHGLGLVETARSGRWFPKSLQEVWEAQEKYVPRRYVREIDALADAVGVPRREARWVNVFPERFHCSGMALRGSATAGGRLIHGRVLDYMTEVGLQATAVITVIAPRGRNAWLNVGYAGCLGTVTAMNERGLAMGEMGGRGEGYLDGMPMTFLMREVMERFETTEEALAWMRSVPRTCEYFYVLSDARTRSMAGVGSWARRLARERGIDDFLILRPGQAHELLPHPVEDAVLMSAGQRYENLARRVRAARGTITPESAWRILGEGVAMRSALHIALLLPETLEVQVAEAGLDASPAYTRPVAHIDLRALLAESAPVASEGPGPAAGAARAPAARDR